MPGAAEADDRFGETVLAHPSGAWIIGVPGEDIGSRTDAGIAIVLSAESASSFHQGTAGVPGSIEAGDHFGGSLGG